MSGDYSRWSFDPHRHFGAVLMQQGRVQTDADWNEWVTTALRRVQAGGLDTFGGAAIVPSETPDGFRVVAAAGELTIGRGRMYVDGLLVENHGAPPLEWDPKLAELRGTTPTPYDAQPYFPDAPAMPASAGPHLVYLKAWQRERTAIEEPSLIEPALGVDTTTRLQTAWQVKVLADVGDSVTCATALDQVPGFDEAEPGAAARLTTGVADVAVEPDPCRVPPSGGYKGLENQLYRVEIHDPGGLSGAGRATFKWSRDNGTVATRITEIPALDRIVVESVGRDAVLGFSDGDWVEITDDVRDLAGLPGEMRRIQAGGGVDETTLTIRLTEPLPAGAFPTDAQGRTTPARNTRLRRWDQHGRVLNAGGDELIDLDAANAKGTIPVAPGPTKILLEHGVVVTFGLETGGRFRTGDHWVFAARTADASVEELEAAPPRGAHAHYAKLALVTFPDSETDCRRVWPPQVAAGEGGECSVRVSPESHASGALTINAAIQRVKQSGGTVCLAAGEYPLSDPVEIHDARSVRLRGQGLATVLVATAAARAIDVRRALAVTIENLSVVASSAERPTDAIRLERCLDATLRRCFVLNLLGEGRAGKGASAVRLAGYAIGTCIDECVLAAETGVAGGNPGEDDESVLVTASLRIASNWLWCTHRGIALGGLAVHLAGARIAGNTIWGCRAAGILADGGSAAGPFDVEGNALKVEGSGIVAGVEALRVSGNDVRGGSGDGIALVRGLDPGGADRSQVLANRVAGFEAAGISVRTRVDRGMVNDNLVAGTGGSGIELAGDGAARVLTVQGNQLSDVARAPVDRAEGDSGPYRAGMRFVEVGELDVTGNTVDRVAMSAWLAVGSAAILTVLTQNARIAHNRLIATGPRERVTNRVCAIELVAPFESIDVVGNTLRRRGAEHVNLELTPWSAVIVADGRRAPEGDARPFVQLGDVAVAKLSDRRNVVLTTTTARLIPHIHFGDVGIRDNDTEGQGATARQVLVTGTRMCDLSNNRIGPPATEGPALLINSARAIVASNDLRSNSEAAVLEVVVRERTVPIVGNLRNGSIFLNGSLIVAPWEPLNPYSVT